MSEHKVRTRSRWLQGAIAAMSCSLGAMAGGLASHATVAPPPLFQTAATNPGNVAYFQPDYPIVFVAARVRNQQSGDRIGTDVDSANTPRGGHELWILLPSGGVKKLFPLPVHAATPGLIDSLPNELDRGAVVEPNVSEDGRRIYFSYFHDADTKAGQTSLPVKGADLYHMHLGPLIDDPTIDPATLVVDRLTTRTNTGSLPNPQDWADTAMNWGFAQSTSLNNWGTVYMHAVEMRQNGRLKLVYVSDERRMRGSNNQSNSYANHNFNLHMADIDDTGALSNRRQFQYYTTTSALSPTPLRNGIAFSYQATTEDHRQWHIQALDSAGRWTPLMGYGHNPFLFHLGAFCVDTKDPSVQHPRGDVFVATLYYVQNNQGFGTLWKQDMSRLGLNSYGNLQNGFKVPRQHGSTKLTPALPDEDLPSPFVGGRYLGKMTSPRCGRADELYFAYTPTAANNKQATNAVYRSSIVYRPNLLPFHPHDPIIPATERGMRIVIEETSDTHTLVWPVPLLSWRDRTGDGVQASAPRAIDPTAPIRPGMPYAQVGTSALWNTDRKPFDCWIPDPPWSPLKAGNINRQNDLATGNQDGLTIVANPSQPCLDLSPARVLGIAVNLTSNKPNMRFGYSGSGYETSGGKPPVGQQNSLGDRHEVARMLGFYDVRQNGQSGDQSFKALIPSNVPFEFHLIDAVYGLKLTDVRSWHSLQSRETRTDCGGCHQHDVNKAPVPFQGTWAQQNPPLDMVTATPHLDYDAACNPVVSPGTAQATRRLPVWQPDIFPGLDQHCGGCHNAAQGSGSALVAFGYANEQEAYAQLKTRSYADPLAGALGSPAFWAARGQRTDGRNNADPKLQKNLSVADWGYFHTASHATNPGMCASNDLAKARWVYRLGLWIDNQMPRNVGTWGNAETDWYHPTADSGVASEDCSPTDLEVGFWDDSGRLETLTVERNGAPLAFYQHTSQTPLTNGSRVLGSLSLIPGDVIRIVAEDAAQNRQMYEKRVSELIEECLLPVAVDAAADAEPPAADE